AGLRPSAPVMAEVGTVEMPLFARITKVPAVARFTEPRDMFGPASFPASVPMAPSLVFPPSEVLPSAAAPSAGLPPSPVGLVPTVLEQALISKKAAPVFETFDFMMASRFFIGSYLL